MATGVMINGRTVIAIREHVRTKEPLSRARERICINESPVRRIIITRLQIIEPRLIIIIVSTISERVDLSQSTGT